MGTLLIQNATIVSEGHSSRGDLLVERDLISAVAAPGTIEPEKAGRIVDATGLLLLPGIIDDQVHFREPGLTHKGDIFTESRAAAAGGITSFMDMPNTIPPAITLRALEEKYSTASEKSVINYSFYIGAANDNLDEIMKTDPSGVCGVKVFMGSSTGNMLVDDESALRELFRNVTIPLAAHCEDEKIIRRNSEIFRQEYGPDIAVKYHPLIRSREACFASSSKAVRLAEKYNTRLHLLHLSTADEMKLLSNELSLADKRITGEVCVHHLWFDDSDYERLGTHIKWNPAIKTRYDRDALLDAVNNNLIDIIATDHAPHTLNEKSETYFKAPSGGPLVQHSLPVMLELWHARKITLEKIVEKMCHNPAIIFNISKRGFVREGYKADLTLVNPDDPWSVTKDTILYRCGWSPFEGITFRSKIIMTIVNGTVVYDNGIINDEYRGERLRFER